MTPKQFKKARKALGLQQNELAKILGIAEVSVRRYEMDETTKNHRQVPEATAELMRAFAGGYRGSRWPKTLKRDRIAA